MHIYISIYVCVNNRDLPDILSTPPPPRVSTIRFAASISLRHFRTSKAVFDVRLRLAFFHNTGFPVLFRRKAIYHSRILWIGLPCGQSS